MKQSMKNQMIFWGVIAAIFVGLRIIMRHFLNVPYDFMPLASLALFSTVILGRNCKAPLLAFSILLLSDMGLSFFQNGASPFYAGFYWQYIAYGLIIALSFSFSRRVSVISTGLFGLSAAIIFFLVSNFGVWATGTLYPMTAHGLLMSYYMGIPFFRASLLGDLFYSYGFYVLGLGLRMRAASNLKHA